MSRRRLRVDECATASVKGIHTGMAASGFLCASHGITFVGWCLAGNTCSIEGGERVGQRSFSDR